MGIKLGPLAHSVTARTQRELSAFQSIFSKSTASAAVMNVGICMCFLFAALSSGSFTLPSHAMPQTVEGEVLTSDTLRPRHMRQARSAPAPPSGQQATYNQALDDAELRSSLSQLLGRLLSGKGSPYQSRSSVSSRASGLSPSHRIKDRDYLGWMDFGRRSAEEYEYSS